MATPTQCSTAGKDGDDNCWCSLCRWIKGLSESAVELSHQILGHLLHVVSTETLQDLLLCREVRKLWDTPGALDLLNREEIWSLHDAVQTFQVGILATHPRIHFCNLSTLQMKVYNDTKLVDSLKDMFILLPLEDLSLWCRSNHDFMAHAVSVWAPSLQHLLILRIKFNRSARKKPRIYPWLQESWSSTLSRLPIRTLWLDTPLPLSDDMERCIPRPGDGEKKTSKRQSKFNLRGHLEEMVQNSWALGSETLRRVYAFFGYDEVLDFGDGMVCDGYRFRIMKLSSGNWKSVDIGGWSEDPVMSTFLQTFYTPFDDLPGILSDDMDHFPDGF